jgi:hypothetical protein
MFIAVWPVVYGTVPRLEVQYVCSRCAFSVVFVFLFAAVAVAVADVLCCRVAAAAFLLLAWAVEWSPEV